MALATIESRTEGAAADGRKPRRKSDLLDTRFDRRLATLLEHAARIFCEKGYEGASMRDLSRATGMSLAGLYHYFESKEELLYLIQKHTFRTIIDQLKVKLEGPSGAEDRVRTFIENHLEYFLANKEAMKVLTHEDETLKNAAGAEVRAIKREYYGICLDLLEDLRRAEGLQFSSRLAVLSLFGMINWIYTWHNPRVDADARVMARQMGDIFLRGVLSPSRPQRKSLRAKS
ncbi:MAG TPA: TetR/AcrR family transcriptional regulator [Candidatus Saccharimonadales bacterium]|jgi:AcrR family transcriptional regulator|nr:TetR/AcrR family transcriptional regulator [Candidatus Saccharimonadales bacterium]